MDIIIPIFAILGLITTPLALYFYFHPRGHAETEKKIALLEQQIIAEQEKFENWEKTKQEHINITQATVMEFGTKLSNKLLDDHKRETEAAKKESEHKIKQTTEELQQKFQKIFGSMDTLHNQVKELDIVRQALLTPTGAGSLGEITLENILKTSRLVKDKDYFLQFTLEGPDGNLLKPDAVISLPGNSLMIIDCKASKHFLDIADSNQDTTKARTQLRKTMNDHLKGLVLRDYKEAFELRRQKDKSLGPVGEITMLMFLPSEAALETLRNIDPQFMENAWEEHIIPVSNAGLMNMLLQSKLRIDNVKAQENVRQIRTEVRNLLGSIAILYDKADALGNSVKSSFKKFDAFAASFNRTFLSQAKKLDHLGITPPKGKTLPKLTRHQMIASDIDGEAEEIVEQPVKQLEEA